MLKTSKLIWALLFPTHWYPCTAVMLYLMASAYSSRLSAPGTAVKMMRAPEAFSASICAARPVENADGEMLICDGWGGSK